VAIEIKLFAISSMKSEEKQTRVSQPPKKMVCSALYLIICLVECKSRNHSHHLFSETMAAMPLLVCCCKFRRL